MPEYFLTFGQQYTPRNQVHPSWGPAHRDGYVVIEAFSEYHARTLALKYFGQAWSMLYTVENWKPEYFYLGEIGRIHRDGVLRDAREYTT